ncbi:MAG: Ig-like domain-containing protein [Victivallales bacterium]|nr:Ig-like domain-containing protein [Victivallales bacterium]
MKKAFVLFLACGLRCFGAEDCTLTVRVLDEVGLPVSNATILVSIVSVNRFNAGSRPSDYTDYTAQTGENGVAIVPFKCFLDGYYEWYVSHPDCYCPGGQRGSFATEVTEVSPAAQAAIDAEKAKMDAGTGGSWLRIFELFDEKYTLLEHAVTNEISVVRMRNPVLLEKRDYTNSRKLKPSASVEIADGVISNSYPRVGFDLRIGEYLMPYGDGGEYPDFWVEQYSIETNGVKTFVGHIELPPGSGVYRAQKEDRQLGPVCFGVDTNQVFTNRLDFTRSSRDGKFLCATPLARGNEYLVFHTRVKDNGDGSMSPGHYSLMEGYVNIYGGIHFRNILFNPRPGETNLEPLPD